MTGCKSNFITLEPYDGGLVTFGTTKSKIIGIGKVGNQNLTISNVYFVDGLNFNLLSIRQLCDVGYDVKFDSQACYLINSKTKQMIYQSDRMNGLYRLYFNHFNEGEICLNAITNQSWLWHRRLAHLSVDSIKNVIKLDLVRGLPLKKIELDDVCGACVKGKQTKSSF